jgi:hypothetical protein
VPINGVDGSSSEPAFIVYRVKCAPKTRPLDLLNKRFG